MVELKGHQQQEMEGRLQCHSHLMLMAQVLIPCWNEIHVSICESSQLKVHMQGTDCMTSQQLNIIHIYFLLMAQLSVSQVTRRSTCHHLKSVAFEVIAQERECKHHSGVMVVGVGGSLAQRWCNQPLPTSYWPDLVIGPQPSSKGSWEIQFSCVHQRAKKRGNLVTTEYCLCHTYI